MKKSFNFIFLAGVVGALALSGATRASEDETDDQKASRERSELQNAQADMAKAYSSYYQALRSQSGGGAKPINTDALQAEIISPAQDKMIALISKRRSESDKMIYGKVYLSDGSVVDAEKFKKDPRNKNPAGDDSSTQASHSEKSDRKKDNEKKKSGPASRSIAEASASGATSTPSFSSDPASNSKRPEWVLDGSGVPKEIVFPGKSGEGQSSAPAAKPKSKVAPRSKQ